MLTDLGCRSPSWRAGPACNGTISNRGSLRNRSAFNFSEASVGTRQTRCRTPFSGRLLHDISTWPVGRLLASYSVRASQRTGVTIQSDGRGLNRISLSVDSPSHPCEKHAFHGYHAAASRPRSCLEEVAVGTSPSHHEAARRFRSVLSLHE